MAAVLLRRSVAAAAIATFATALVPTAVSFLAPTAAGAATAAPKMDDTASAPAQNGSLANGGENITAVFDQEITGTSGKSGTTCKDTSGASQCAFILYEVNADGSRGVRLPGETTFDTSGNPITGVQDTVIFNPDFALIGGNSYEALVQVFGVDADGKKVPAAVTNLDYKVFITAQKPFNMSAPQYANTQNAAAFPLSGFAPSGFTVTVNVENPNGDPTGQSDASGSTVVEACPSAPLCPWTATVDLSGSEWPSSPTTQIDWTANEQDANGTPSAGIESTASQQTPKATFLIDKTPPDVPSSTPASGPTLTQDPSQHTASVNVNAQEADNANNSDVNSYLITVSDASDNKVTQTFPSSGNDLPAKTIDVTTLDDGQLTVLIQAVDTHGNVSSDSCSSFPPGQPCSKYSGSGLVKSVGLVPNLGTSILTSSSGDTTFSEAQQGKAVRSLTKVTVGFTQTIKEAFSDCCTSSGPVTNHSSMCIATPNGNCLLSAAPTVADDHKSISMKVGSKLDDGTYAVRVHTYSQSNCKDRTPADYAQPGGPPACESYGDLVRLPGTGDPGTVFTFKIDSTKPTVAITTFPKKVTAKNQKHVNISGTVSKTVSQLQLFISSSGGTSRLLYNATITPRANPSDPTADWASGPLDISSLPDGKLTIKAVAKNSNGTTARDTVHAEMAAHASHLTAAVNHSRTVAGKQLKVTGVLTDENHDPIANAVIKVRPRFSPGHFGKAVAAVADSNGGYTAKVVAKRNATYVAKYDGSPQHDGVKNDTKRVLVHYAVTITSPDFGDSVGSSVTVRGKVFPNHKGAMVTIYRHTSSGNVVVGKDRLNKHSKFSAHVVLPPGKVVIFAKVTKSSHNLAGKSKRLTLHVS
jgi:hypothetical protein